MMRLVTDDSAEAPPADAPADVWPAEVDMILSAMDVARDVSRDGSRSDANEVANRRSSPRYNRRTRAELQLFAHDPLQPAIVLYTRDLSRSGMGFITRERLPLGYGGLVAVTLVTGQMLWAHCNVYRCREAINGWFEGALSFAQDQPALK